MAPTTAWIGLSRAIVVHGIVVEERVGGHGRGEWPEALKGDKQVILQAIAHRHAQPTLWIPEPLGPSYPPETPNHFRGNEAAPHFENTHFMFGAKLGSVLNVLSEELKRDPEVLRACLRLSNSNVKHYKALPIPDIWIALSMQEEKASWTDDGAPCAMGLNRERRRDQNHLAAKLLQRFFSEDVMSFPEVGVRYVLAELDLLPKFPPLANDTAFCKQLIAGPQEAGGGSGGGNPWRAYLVAEPPSYTNQQHRFPEDVMSQAGPLVREDLEMMRFLLAYDAEQGRSSESPYKSLTYAAPVVLRDKAFFLTILSEHPWALQHAAEELREDKEVVLAALAANQGVLQFALGEARWHPDVVARARGQQYEGGSWPTSAAVGRASR